MPLELPALDGDPGLVEGAEHGHQVTVHPGGGGHVLLVGRHPCRDDVQVVEPPHVEGHLGHLPVAQVEGVEGSAVDPDASRRAHPH
ncbi:hypothetical protein D3C87_1889500 [compost metagenome]